MAWVQLLTRARQSLLHSVQTGSGAHPASCPMGTGVFFLEGKAAQVKNGGTIPPLPIRLHGVVLNQLIIFFYILYIISRPIFIMKQT
jgi:hypothetical protein